ncbi:hypothetical protein [Streptomyces sp. 3N207]|uniref:hypothetical protein n=1 Tax=Streptomyces sp. 3N207 TaxID=3457417 RepID=UPI003FD42E48
MPSVLSDLDGRLVVMRTLFSGEFSVAYGQMYIDSRTDPDEGPEAGLHECFMAQQAGLCGAAFPGHLFLLTGLHTGSVPFTVELHEAEPSSDVDGWEDIVETSFRTASDVTQLIEWGGEGWDLDVALVHAIDEAGADVQRAIARWAAHRSCHVNTRRTWAKR